MSNEKDTLVTVPLLALTVPIWSTQKPSLKVHPKHLKRIKQLRIEQRLTHQHLSDLQHFPRLESLSLSHGTDGTETLAEIPVHLKTSKPVSLRVSLDIFQPRPLYREAPGVEGIGFRIESQKKINLRDATWAEFYCECPDQLPDLSGWSRLEQLNLGLEETKDIYKFIPPPNLKYLGVGCGQSVFLSQRESSTKGWSLEFSKDLLGKITLDFKGDLSGFEKISLSAPLTWKGSFCPNASVLQVDFDATEKDLETYLKQIAKPSILQVKYESEIDFARLVSQNPNLKHLQLILFSEENVKPAQNLADRLQANGLKTVLMLTDASGFETQSYDSERRTWVVLCNR